MAIDSSIEKLRADFHAKIRDAFSSGMSVIELTNLFGYSSINFVHGVLLGAKLIPSMSRTGKRQSYDIDHRLQQVLEKIGYSFARWCAGWGLDPNEAATALRKKQDEGMSSAHEAVRRDFPDAYLEIFEGKPPFATSQEKKTYPRLSLNIIWDEVRMGYVASVPETPGVEGYRIQLGKCLAEHVNSATLAEAYWFAGRFPLKAEYMGGYRTG
jgi:hypothetical protein